MNYKDKLNKRIHPLPNSYFLLELQNGEIIDEREYSWHNFSDEILVKYQDSMKRVKLCNLDATKIYQVHNDLKTEMDIPKGTKVYQAIKSQTRFVIDHINNHKILGRIIGLVKDGEVIEERFLDGQLNEVIGFKK